MANKALIDRVPVHGNERLTRFTQQVRDLLNPLILSGVISPGGITLTVPIYSPVTDGAGHLTFANGDVVVAPESGTPAGPNTDVVAYTDLANVFDADAANTFVNNLVVGSVDATASPIRISLYDAANDAYNTIDSGDQSLTLGQPLTVLGDADVLGQLRVTNAGGAYPLTLRTAATGDDPVVRWLQARAATTDATQTTLDSFSITAGRTYLIEARVLARRTGGSGGTADDGAVYVRRAMATTKTGTVTLNAVQDGLTQEDQAGWDCTLDVSGTSVRIRVTGAANNDVTWHSTTTIQDVGS